ncbi:MAG TPA: diguanylate cyclase [Pyrinomonadaceae bacterium]|nr:diguanylate cyclase [Pyrinomonadaceae bacterium]
MNRKSPSKPASVTPDHESEILQEHRADAPSGWPEIQDKLAGALGLSILLVDGRQPPALVVSNNNSVCQAFQTSPKHVGLCDPYCGDAHRRAMSAGAPVQYKCHAGLQCVTIPVQIAGEQNLAVIGGRAFLSSADYRALVDRFRAGELNELIDRDPFDNVVFAESQRIEELPERVYKAVRKLGGSAAQPVAPVKASTRKPAESRTNAADTANVPATSERFPVPTEREPQTLQRDLQIEVDRLRLELEHRSNLVQSLQSFLERISSTDPVDTYQAILTHSCELLQAERASLMIYDEGSNEIILKASIGISEEGSSSSRTRLGEGVAGQTLKSGQPLVVENLEAAGLKPSAANRSYKTKSFISYPIIVRGRRIGLLNFTDKTNGGNFNDVDLSLLELIGPQIAVALERADWQERATQFQLMSITDPLTGLLNRRYLEERLTEELNRSSRYNYPMSCLMIDIDDFKKYNDRNGHQAGDVALKITAHSLKAALRSADVACRYGGEEFCVLLPQTSISEAGVIAERMRQRVAETDYPFGKSQPMGTVSISIGISTLAKNIDTAERVIAAADRALYRAKAEGKNRIEFYDGHLSGAFAGK